MKGIYELRLYDETLVTFELTVDTAFGYSVRIDSINGGKKALLPIDLDLTGEGMLNWLEHRVIPKNRMFVDEILRSFGLTRADTKGIIDICKGLSLNDSF